MTIKECYEAMGGDYEDVLKRLMNEARIQKFALMFNIVRQEVPHF